uniref:Uncharacterized protein n=1 Tax=Panagrolaimus sp. ES5 TaxID=591445 RepID=A0AC34GB63_9BILA
MKFRDVYKWAECQALKKQNESNDEVFDLKTAVKMELTEILPLFEFSRMSKEFLTEFLVGNGIISVEKIAKIHKVYVTIRNNGKLIAGSFDDESGIFDDFICKNGQNNWMNRVTPGTHNLNIDDKFYMKPSKPSTFSKNTDRFSTSWYLCIKRNGTLALKHRSAVFSGDYLLAKMKPPDLDINVDFSLERQHITSVKARRAKFNIN